MQKRTLTTLCIWGIIIGALYLFGPTAGAWLLLLLSTMALNELFTVLRAIGYEPLPKTAMVMGGILILGPYYLPHMATGGGLGGLLLGLMFVALGLLLLYRPTQLRWFKDSVMPTFWAIVAVPYCLHFFIEIFRSGVDSCSPMSGLILALWAITVAKFTDIGGLLAGYLWGKHKMAPNISPKKTWEGAIGGLALSIAVGVVFFTLAQSVLPETFTLSKAIWMAAVLSLVSIPSDLFESVLKRLADIKDSGHSLPGIGGALDLADSLLFVGPVAYLLFSYAL